MHSGNIELYNDSVIRSNTAGNAGNDIYCDNAGINLYNESVIGDVGGVICVACAIRKFDESYRIKKDYCPSNQPNNNSAKDGGSSRTYLILCAVLFVIGIMIGCCYFYKKRTDKHWQYEGLLKT